MLPVGRTECFRNDLGYDENEECDDSRDESEPLAAEQQRGLLPYPRSTNGVSNGVEGEDSSERPVGLGLIKFHAGGGFKTLRLPHGYVTERRGHETGLQDGAQERDAQRQEQV